MSLDLDDVLNDAHWITVEVDGGSFRVAYRPSSSSMRRQAELAKMQRTMATEEGIDELDVMRRVAKIFCEVISGWDLTRSGRALPLDPETVLDLPQDIFDAVMDAVTADRQARKDEKKALNATSAVTSTQEDKLVTAQNGIPSFEPRGTWA